MFYSCGTWSSTRPAVFYIGRIDGILEVWDLSEQSRACSVAFVVAATAVTCLAFPSSGQHDCQEAAKPAYLPGETRDTEGARKNSEASSGLLAVGDGSGVVHIVSLPKNLTAPVSKTVSILQVYIISLSENGYRMCDYTITQARALTRVAHCYWTLLLWAVNAFYIGRIVERHHLGKKALIGSIEASAVSSVQK